MKYKTFQVVLVVLIVVFTAAGLVLFVSPLTSLLVPGRAGGIDSHGIVTIPGGVSTRIFNLIIIVVPVLAIAIIYLISRRRKLP